MPTPGKYQFRVLKKFKDGSQETEYINRYINKDHLMHNVRKDLVQHVEKQNEYLRTYYTWNRPPELLEVVIKSYTLIQSYE